MGEAYPILLGNTSLVVLKNKVMHPMKNPAKETYSIM